MLLGFCLTVKSVLRRLARYESSETSIIVLSCLCAISTDQVLITEIGPFWGWLTLVKAWWRNWKSIAPILIIKIICTFTNSTQWMRGLVAMPNQLNCVASLSLVILKVTTEQITRGRLAAAATARSLMMFNRLCHLAPLSTHRPIVAYRKSRLAIECSSGCNGSTSLCSNHWSTTLGCRDKLYDKI